MEKGYERVEKRNYMGESTDRKKNRILAGNVLVYQAWVSSITFLWIVKI